MQDFEIEAMWGPRPEEPDQIAGRIRSLVARLRPITPAFGRWYQIIDDDNMPELDADETWLDSVVESDVFTGELGEPIPYLGYMSRTTNDPTVFSTRLDDVLISTHVGSHGRFNGVKLRSGSGKELPPSVVNYPVVRRTVLAISHAFEPLWCEAGPYCLWEHMDMSPYTAAPMIMTPCWMVHLSPPLAARITPPSDVTCERFDDGSLFLAVTEQTFDPDNAEHVAAAHRLFAVLDPLQEKKPPEQRRR